MAKTVTITSPIKVITSGKAPDSTKLANGQIAVGEVSNVRVIYANVNGTVVDMLAGVKADITAAASTANTAAAGVATNRQSITAITDSKGKANGIATLDSSGKVPAGQLPSYVDDVIEGDSKSEFPDSGETGKIYVAKDTGKTYRWSGSAYVEISASLALGETSSTAYAGDKGKANAAAIAVLNTFKSKVASDQYVRPTGWTVDYKGAGFNGSGSLGNGIDIKASIGDGSESPAQVAEGFLHINNATASANGMMSAGDKSTLDTLSTTAITSISLTVEAI